MKFLWIIGLIIVILFIANSTLSAQIAEEVLKPEIRQAAYMDISPPLREIPPVPNLRDKNRLIKNYRFPTFSEVDEEDFNIDTVIQNWVGSRDKSLRQVVVNFEGLDENGGAPGDPVGDVGPNHYVQMVNSELAIWDKEGNLLYGPVQNRTLWSGMGNYCASENDGDPIVFYDHLADRWILTQFALPDEEENEFGDYFECVAVSASDDPTGSYYRYAFSFGNVFPDYPKFGLWPDGYYMSTNEFVGNFGAGIVAMDRESMLEGDPDAEMIYFSLYNQRSFLPADLDGPLPPEGSPAFFAKLSGNTQVQIYEFSANWENPAAATFLNVGNINVAPFDSYLCGGDRDCIPQPDVSDGLDALSSRLMNRLQYRNFGDYQVLMANHTVDADFNHAGIRWYEFRKENDDWVVHQQSTFAPDDHHRWMASIAMDGAGNIGLGYSISSEEIYPGIRFTGRHADDPLNAMTYPEITLMAGSGSQTGSGNRWGDYSALTVDPLDDETFWFTTQYQARTGSFNWQTRICALDTGPIILPEFTADLITGNAPHTVQFTDHSVGYPEITDWAWDFDADGIIDSHSQNPGWTYENPGNYSVTLTVSNDLLSESETHTHLIRIFGGEAAVQFAADGGHAQCPSSPDIALNETLTLEAWIHPADWGPQGDLGFGRVIDKGTISLFIKGDGGAFPDHSLGLNMNTSAGVTFFFSPDYSIELEQWQHVAITYDGFTNEVILYINGESQALTHFGSLPNGAVNENFFTDIYIGINSLLSLGFDGGIDEVRIWNITRTPDQIAATWDHYLLGDEDGLVGYWKMNEGNGQLIQDYSLHGHDGILTGAAWMEGTYLNPVSVETPTDETGSAPVLSQNYPNPFNPATQIRFFIPKTAPVSLEIYNVAGQCVRTLLNNQSIAGGWRHLIWNGENDRGEAVVSGVYLYQLTTPDGFLSRQMILLQ